MKVFFDLVGCRLNQSEIEDYARQMTAAGHSVVPTFTEADIAVVNTCDVTNQAEADSRQKVRQIARSGIHQVFITGCWATMHTAQACELVGVSKVIPNSEKDDLVRIVLAENGLQLPSTPIPKKMLDGNLNDGCLNGPRQRTRAFIKVQDGCDHHCTFCVTTLARGKARSRIPKDVVNQIKEVIAQGVKEVVLSGVQLGSYGKEQGKSDGLTALIQMILDQTNLSRLRLSSLEPWNISDQFLELWEDERLCRHIHLPLQSGCEQTMKRMGRRTTPFSYAALVEKIRRISPDIAVTTDIMVGFPGETDEEFVQSCEFVRSMNFADGHVFSFSERPTTLAEKMQEKVPHSLRKERNGRMREILSDSSLLYRNRFINRTLSVLWENAQSNSPLDGEYTWHLRGLTDNYIRVIAKSNLDLWNNITPVQLISVIDNQMEGIVSITQPVY